MWSRLWPRGILHRGFPNISQWLQRHEPFPSLAVARKLGSFWLILFSSRLLLSYWSPFACDKIITANLRSTCAETPTRSIIRISRPYVSSPQTTAPEAQTTSDLVSIKVERAFLCFQSSFRNVPSVKFSTLYTIFLSLNWFMHKRHWVSLCFMTIDNIRTSVLGDMRMIDTSGHPCVGMPAQGFLPAALFYVSINLSILTSHSEIYFTIPNLHSNSPYIILRTYSNHIAHVLDSNQRIISLSVWQRRRTVH